MKDETAFRARTVLPFLKTLSATSYFPIQQLAIRADADYILCSRGRFVWLELKRSEKDALRALQAYKASWVTKTGGVAIKADPQNWPSVKAILRQIDQGDYDG